MGNLARYLSRVLWDHLYSKILGGVSTILTFIGLFYDLRLNDADLPTFAWILILLVWAVYLLGSGFVVWHEDLQVYTSGRIEVSELRKSFQPYQWINVTREEQVVISEPVIINFFASFEIVNHVARRLTIKVSLDDVDSNWSLATRLSEIELEVTHPTVGGKYPGRAFTVEAQGIEQISVKGKLPLSPNTLNDTKFELRPLEHLGVTLRLESPGKTPVLKPVKADVTAIEAEFHRKLTSLVHHDLVRQNHWEQKLFEIYAALQVDKLADGGNRTGLENIA